MSKDTDGMTKGVEPDQIAPLRGDLYCLPSLYYLSKYMYHNDSNFWKDTIWKTAQTQFKLLQE